MRENRMLPIARMLRRLPVFPRFGHGQMQLQPAYVEDVADAIAKGDAECPSLYVLRARRAARLHLQIAARNDCPAPRQKTASGSDPVFGLWHALASVAEMLPGPSITRNQVELMQFEEFGVAGCTRVRRLADFDPHL